MWHPPLFLREGRGGFMKRNGELGEFREINSGPGQVKNIKNGRGVGVRHLVSRDCSLRSRSPGVIPAKQMQTPVKLVALQGFCFLPVLHQASLVRPCRKQNHPDSRRGGLHLLCGERGIRTPGTVTHTAV